MANAFLYRLGVCHLANKRYIKRAYKIYRPILLISKRRDAGVVERDGLENR
jgi:hypothetical protein